MHATVCSMLMEGCITVGGGMQSVVHGRSDTSPNSYTHIHARKRQLFVNLGSPRANRDVCGSSTSALPHNTLVCLLLLPTYARPVMKVRCVDARWHICDRLLLTEMMCHTYTGCRNRIEWEERTGRTARGVFVCGITYVPHCHWTLLAHRWANTRRTLPTHS
jgi:hypothetical protein